VEDGILIVREFDEMSRTFSEQFKNMENKVPRDLMKEYDTPEGGKVREVGPIVYKYSMTIGSGAKPKIREFGNINSPFVGRGFFNSNNHQFLQKIEPLVIFQLQISS
jgi:HSP20 family protein